MKDAKEKIASHLQSAFESVAAFGGKARANAADIRASFRQAVVSARAQAPVLARKALKTARTFIRVIFGAAALASAGLAVTGTLKVIPYSKTQNIALLNACNEARANGKACTLEGEAEKQRSLSALKYLGMFSVGFFGTIGFAALAMPAEKKKKPGAKPG